MHIELVLLIILNKLRLSLHTGNLGVYSFFIMELISLKYLSDSKYPNNHLFLNIDFLKSQ